MSAKIRMLLRKTGLTDYEVNAYLVLLEKGALTAKQVSYGAQIPYSKVYQTLNSLEKKGWIEVTRKRPSKYFPKSPETALKTAKTVIENEWLQIEKAIADELMPSYEKIKTREKYDIWILRGLLNIVSKFKEMVKNCRQELLIAFPSIKEEFLLDFYQLLHSFIGEKMQVRFMVSKGMNENVYRTLSKVGEVRRKAKMFGGGAISDGDEVLLLFSDERGEITAIWSDHPGLASLAKDYFNYLWKESEGEL
ncbi:MAG: helix-turn-helix domain-containing protein [Candidatus Bathyarchaeota archaeon]|jgi:sugar-specific transcriptional regulator TrmB|nr:TrmB family transcriptional regulator [Candidatus Bathyarchaeota archaeon A05DMB-3]MDH7606863.1 helix-turn-helix domain-containing protein [Candidatus Bathyarchaeota archaeon]